LAEFFLFPKVDFREYFLASGSRLPKIFLTSESRLSVMIFDFRKSTSGDIFWLLEVDFRWYILTSESWLPVIYFDFRKSYILTSGSRHPEVFLGVWCPWIFLNGQRVFWEFKKKWRCRRNARRCRKKDPSYFSESISTEINSEDIYCAL